MRTFMKLRCMVLYTELLSLPFSSLLFPSLLVSSVLICCVVFSVCGGDDFATTMVIRSAKKQARGRAFRVPIRLHVGQLLHVVSLHHRPWMLVIGSI